MCFPLGLAHRHRCMQVYIFDFGYGGFNPARGNVRDTMLLAHAHMPERAALTPLSTPLREQDAVMYRVGTFAVVAGNV